jgi:hypothetical protein
MGTIRGIGLGLAELVYRFWLAAPSAPPYFERPHSENSFSSFEQDNKNTSVFLKRYATASIGRAYLSTEFFAKAAHLFPDRWATCSTSTAYQRIIANRVS